ncbi:MAG: ABC transporter permease [Verrucomicrobiota bacterium]|jgi:putative ABC transport system permease protein
MTRHILSEAFNALRHYRLRSALTMLSVAWGVASLTLLLSYGQGFKVALVEAFDQIGKDLIVIFPGQTSEQAGGERSGRRILLELKDVEALREGVPAIEAISPEIRFYRPVNFGYRTRNYSIAGVHAAYGRIRNMEVAEGRFLSDDDVLQHRRVAVIGADLKKQLFSGIPAIGEDIKIDGARFSVVGVLQKKTQISNYTSPDDLSAFTPYSTLAAMMNSRYLENIVVLPAQNLFRHPFIASLRASLARAHHFGESDERAVTILDWNEFKVLVTSMSAGLEILLLIIGTLTLSIGAVGVMNIMLVSVTERTREIGVLKALGARRRHILLQILLEGLTLTTLGGLLGFVIAALATRLIGTLPLLGPLFEDTSGRSDIHLGLSVHALGVATVVLILVGLIAGLLPAVRASRLDPVAAMRSD